MPKVHAKYTLCNGCSIMHTLQNNMHAEHSPDLLMYNQGAICQLNGDKGNLDLSKQLLFTKTLIRS